MVTSEEIDRALAIWHNRRRGIGKRHSRLHLDALNDNVYRESALRGLCGQCQNCRIKFAKDGGLSIAGVGCRTGKSPLRLYQFAKWGEEVTCDKFTRRQPESL